MENKKATTNTVVAFNGGEDATRTHNALRHTTFPMWLLTIRIPLRIQTTYILLQKNRKMSRGKNKKI